MLSLLVFFPLIFPVLFFLLPKNLKALKLAGAFIFLVLALSLFSVFDPSSSEPQLTERFFLIKNLGFSYFLALDGLSFWYILLTALLLLSATALSSNPRPLYFCLLFVLSGCITGAFLSFDSLLFYIFFEASLLPLFFLIYLFGGEKKVYASFKFLIYTFTGSVFLLAGLVALSILHHTDFGAPSFSLPDLYRLNIPFDSALSPQSLIFIAFAIAFAVKTPLAPFHSWLPLAHVEAPAGASAFLAAIVLKMGTYGWLRFVLPLFPDASLSCSPALLFMAVAGILYTGLIAFHEKDIKKVAAYSSIAHMGFVLLGVFSFNFYGLAGGFYQTIAHGASSASLFFLTGVLYERAKTRNIDSFGNLIQFMPIFGILFFIAALSTIAFPLTGGFIGEFLALLGSFLSGKLWVWPAVLGLVLSAVYILRLYQKMFFLKESPLSAQLKDLNLKEFSVLAPWALLILALGIFPQWFLKYSSKSLDSLMAAQKLETRAAAASPDSASKSFDILTAAQKTVLHIEKKTERR